MNRILNVTTMFLLMSCVIAINNINAQIMHTTDIYASYFGGTGGDYMTYLTVDKDTNVIIAGHTTSTNLYVSPSAFQTARKASPDGFITKFNPDMSQVLFSTYFGGNDYDEIKDVVVDSLGNIYVTGMTLSSDFPITKNAFDTTYNGDFDAFVAKFSPDGNLLYSTYVGGSKYEDGMRIKAISSSRVILTGATGSNDFPLQPAVTDTIRGGIDVFALALDMSTSTILFSKRFGGVYDENPFSLQIDKSDNIYVCGYTLSPDFPVKAGFNSTFGGIQDGFLCKLTSNGEIIHSSFVGGSGIDKVVELAINDKDEVYFLGGSASFGLTCSANAFSSTKKGTTDIIIGKLNSSGDSLLYFSYYGGNSMDNLYISSYSYCYGKISLLSDDRLVIAGQTNSTNLEITDGAYGKKADFDMFVSVLDIANKETQYFSYFGTASSDELEGLYVLNDSVVYISGNAGPGFQISSNAYQKTNRGNGDAVFARIKFHESPTAVHEKKSESVPNKFQLNQNYPNPFNPSTVISYQLSAHSNVKLIIYNMLGQKIKALVNSYQNIGEHSFVWDATDENNNQVSSGVYFYRLQTDKMNLQNKMTLLR
jgi:hypothetical protein